MRGEKSLFSGQEICPRGRRKEDQTPSADQSPPPSLLPNSEKGSFPLITPFLSPRRSEAGTTTTTRFILGVEGRSPPNRQLGSPPRPPTSILLRSFLPHGGIFFPCCLPSLLFPCRGRKGGEEGGKGKKSPLFCPSFLLRSSRLRLLLPPPFFACCGPPPPPPLRVASSLEGKKGRTVEKRGKSSQAVANTLSWPLPPPSPPFAFP